VVLHRIAGGITVALLFSAPGTPFGRDSYRVISWHIEDRSARVLRRVLPRSGRLFGLILSPLLPYQRKEGNMSTAVVWSRVDREAKDVAIGDVSSVCVIGWFVAPGMPVLLPGALTLEGARQRRLDLAASAKQHAVEGRRREVEMCCLGWWTGHRPPARGERIRSRAPSSRWRGGVASSHRGVVDPG
jgi:hypothetical protein